MLLRTYVLSPHPETEYYVVLPLVMQFQFYMPVIPWDSFLSFYHSPFTSRPRNVIVAYQLLRSPPLHGSCFLEVGK